MEGKLCLFDTLPYRRASEPGPSLRPPSAWPGPWQETSRPLLPGKLRSSWAWSWRGKPAPFSVNDAVVHSLLSQSPPVWQAAVAERGERTHRDELDAVVGGGALDTQDGRLDTGFLEGFAHVTAFLLLGVRGGAPPHLQPAERWGRATVRPRGPGVPCPPRPPRRVAPEALWDPRNMQSQSCATALPSHSEERRQREVSQTRKGPGS